MTGLQLAVRRVATQIADIIIHEGVGGFDRWYRPIAHKWLWDIERKYPNDEGIAQIREARRALEADLQSPKTQQEPETGAQGETNA